METGLHARLKGLLDDHLCDSVCDGWYAEHPHTTMRLRYLYHQHGWREVTTRGQPVPELVQII